MWTETHARKIARKKKRKEEMRKAKRRKRNCLDQVTQEKEAENEKFAGIKFAELKTIKMRKLLEMIEMREMIKT